jgi:hypothetical protein
MRSRLAVAGALCATTLSGLGAWNTTPAGAGAPLSPPPATSTSSSLTGVACPAAASCTAVGFATSAGVQVPLAESWNGKTWTVQTVPHPAGFDRGALYTVACTSATSCTAVGQFDNSKGAQLMLAVHWNGKAWAVQPTPAPATYYGQQLNGIACPGTTACFAVGTYFKGTGQQVTLTEHWNGRTWTTEAAPAGTPYYLTGISCTSAASCTAVGSFAKGGGIEQALVERWNGKTWTTEAAANPKGSAGAYPLGVACATATSCVAVGNYQTSTAFLDLAEGWDGTAWAVQATPKPATGDSSFLNGVECSAATNCGAVGYTQGPGGNTTAAADAWNGKAWAVKSTPVPTGATSSALYGEACSSTTACTAVGTYQKGTGQFVFAERWNGRSWALETVPNG